MSAITPSSEFHRISAVRSYQLFGTDAEPEFDRFTTFAARLFDAPMALISLVGEDALWFKSRVGFKTCSAPRDIAVLGKVLDGKDIAIVLDTTQHRELREHPWVVGEPHVRFYAGAPLIDAQGVFLGGLAILDTSPRSEFSSRERDLLAGLAGMVVEMMAASRSSFDRQVVGNFADAAKLTIVTANAEGRLTSWHGAAQEIFGYSAAEAIGSSLDLLVPERFRDEHAAGLKSVVALKDPQSFGKVLEAVARRRDGTEFPVEMTLAAWEGRVGLEYGALLRDISHRRDQEKNLQRLALHDTLTGLWNRQGFQDRVDQSLASRSLGCMLALDLDNFKAVNDNFGHAFGDAVLEKIALRLSSIGLADSIMGRLGGDEFGIFLAGVGDAATAVRVAGRVLEVAAEPFRVNGRQIDIGFSMGAALAPLHATGFGDLMLRADLASLEAKKAGGQRIQLFDEPMAGVLLAQQSLCEDVSDAVRSGQWRLHYQPQVSLEDGRLIGAEALLRWAHPTNGTLRPSQFLPILESHPAACEIGDWVIHEACRQLAEWRRQGLALPQIGVNLFSAQLTSDRLETVLSACMEEFALHPSDLELEITETIALRTDAKLLGQLVRLRDRGFRLAFDDFGTGFASLSSVKDVPVTRLKVDRSFVQDICTEAHSLAIVSAIQTLAERLDLEVIAEGIENEQQLETLRGLGIRFGQGFALGRPGTGTAFAALFAPAAAPSGKARR